MESVLINVKNNKEKEFIVGMASLMGLASSILTIEDKEDFAFGLAIKEGLKSGYADTGKVIAKLKKKAGK